jgi:hypothetical protein
VRSAYLRRGCGWAWAVRLAVAAEERCFAAPPPTGLGCLGRVCGGLDREMRKLPPSNGLPLANSLPLTYVSVSPHNCTPFICTFPNFLSSCYKFPLPPPPQSQNPRFSLRAPSSALLHFTLTQSGRSEETTDTVKVLRMEGLSAVSNKKEVLYG